jgi:hypothetical protein
MGICPASSSGYLLQDTKPNETSGLYLQKQTNYDETNEIVKAGYSLQ